MSNFVKKEVAQAPALIQLANGNYVTLDSEAGAIEGAKRNKASLKERKEFAAAREVVINQQIAKLEANVKKLQDEAAGLKASLQVLKPKQAGAKK